MLPPAREQRSASLRVSFSGPFDSFVSAPLSDLLLDALGRFWIVLGPPLGALWSPLGPLWELLGSSSAPLGSLWELQWLQDLSQQL